MAYGKRISTLLLILIMAFGVQASSLSVEPVVFELRDNAPADTTAPLTKALVQNYISTRIATHKLQIQYQENAEQYDDVIQAFYRERKQLLNQKGWEVAEFEELEERIIRAETGLEIAEDLAESKKTFEKDVAEIRANQYLSNEQKTKLIEAKKQLREQQRLQYVEPTKPDWPAVQAYHNKLKQLTAWIAGTINEPPSIE